MALYNFYIYIFIGDKFREKIIECEVREGFFKYDLNDIKKRRERIHGGGDIKLNLE